MSLALHRRADISPEQIAALDAALTAFYRNPPSDYYQVADESSQHYNTQELPFHCDLVGRVVPGTTVLELGCGTAHICPHIEAHGGNYTGIDHSEKLLRENRRRFPRARFLPIGMPLEERFDMVASLYTIEHVVDPVAYLELMLSYCKPGGLMGVICPEFVEGDGLAPSVFYGKSPRRLREKLQALAIFDLCLHLIDWKILRARWIRLARQAAPGAFWINLKPRVLHGASYTIDADAVHLSRLKDLVWYFEQRGAMIVQTSAKMQSVAPEILRFNCYLLARKPTQV